jgi:hypothetical protein
MNANTRRAARYELLKRAKSWDKRQAMIEGHFGGRRRQGELLDE